MFERTWPPTFSCRETLYLVLSLCPSFCLSLCLSLIFSLESKGGSATLHIFWSTSRLSKVWKILQTHDNLIHDNLLSYVHPILGIQIHNNQPIYKVGITNISKQTERQNHTYFRWNGINWYLDIYANKDKWGNESNRKKDFCSAHVRLLE